MANGTAPAGDTLGKMAAAVLLAVGLRAAHRTLAAAGSRGAQVRSSQRDEGSCRHWRVPGLARAALIPTEPLPLPRVKFRDSAQGRSDSSPREKRSGCDGFPEQPGASWLRWSRCCCPGACFRLSQPCLLQEVSAPFWELAGCLPRTSGPIICTSFAPSSFTHHHTQQRFNLPYCLASL